jgi:hypothetical protein
MEREDQDEETSDSHIFDIIAQKDTLTEGIRFYPISLMHDKAKIVT